MRKKREGKKIFRKQTNRSLAKPQNYKLFRKMERLPSTTFISEEL